MNKVKQVKISDLLPDDANFNTGTEFGNSLIEKSLSKFGAGRSILIDKNNRIIAGNKTIENAAQIGLENIRIIETDGSEIVAVKRTDIDLDSKRGREMALADNATAKANISWDVEKIFDWEMPVNEWGIAINTSEANDPNAEWENMPEFNNPPNAFHTIHCHFKEEKDLLAFAEVIGRELSKNVKTFWFVGNE